MSNILGLQGDTVSPFCPSQCVSSILNSSAISTPLQNLFTGLLPQIQADLGERASSSVCGNTGSPFSATQTLPPGQPWTPSLTGVITPDPTTDLALAFGRITSISLWVNNAEWSCGAGYWKQSSNLAISNWCCDCDVTANAGFQFTDPYDFVSSLQPPGSGGFVGLASQRRQPFWCAALFEATGFGTPFTVGNGNRKGNHFGSRKGNQIGNRKGNHLMQNTSLVG